MILVTPVISYIRDNQLVKLVLLIAVILGIQSCAAPSVYVRDFCILYQPVKLTDAEKFLLHTDRYDETNKPLVMSIKRKIVTNNLIYEDTCK